MTPSKVTLRKYGLTEDEWNLILKRQGGVCPICEKEPSTGRFVIDHEHVKGWKKMPPEERKKYVRGILCWYCNNKILSRGVTRDKLYNAYVYLNLYEDKRYRQILETLK